MLEFVQKMQQQVKSKDKKVKKKHSKLQGDWKNPKQLQTGH